jgi:hypothetical protein
MARRDIGHFCEYVFGWPRAAVPMHAAWHRFIDECWAQGLAAGIMAPRSHGKTQQIARARVLWELGRSTLDNPPFRPDLRIKLIQNTDEKAGETISQIKRDIEGDAHLHNVFPNLKQDPDAKWTDHKLYIKRSGNPKDASLEGAGILSSQTGGRGDIIILDDVCDLKNSVLEPARRKSVISAYDAVIFNLREPWTRFCAIGTAWHELDLNAELQRRADVWAWQLHRIQDNAGDEFRVLWPGKWDKGELERSQANNPREFERAFNNRPYLEGESVVDWNGVLACMDPRITLGTAPFNTTTRIAGYDLAISMKDDACSFAWCVLGSGGGGKIIPLELGKAKLPFRQQVETVRRIAAQWGPQLHVVENNAYQDALVQQLQAEAAYLPIVGHTTGKNKMDPNVGVPSLDPAFRSRQWIIPTGGGHDGTDQSCHCGQCEWLRELRYFPATSSDLVMAVWFAFANIRGHASMGEASGTHVTETAVASEIGRDPFMQ